MIFLNIQEFLIKHVFQMSHRAASISKNSDFQVFKVLSYQQKERRHNQILNYLAIQTISLKILIDSTGYMVKTLLGSKVDEVISWVCEISYNGNQEAGRLNKILVALQTSGLK